MSLKHSFAVASSVAAIALAFSAPVQSAAISASVSITAYAEVRLGVVAQATDTQSSASSWGTLLDPLTASATAFAVDIASDSDATAFGSISAMWGNANAGSVDFRNYGWDAHLFGGRLQLTNLNQGTPDWTYTFIADANGTFIMDYLVAMVSGNPFGLQGWNIDWSGPGGGLALQDASTPVAAGSFARSVMGGQQYTVSLSNNANVSGGPISGVMDGDFDWRIVESGQPAPIPGSLALLALGALAIPLARRKR